MTQTNSISENLDNNKNRLKNLLGHRYEKFKVMMAANHVVLSGSTIVQILLNEHWEDSDLDFFNPVKEITTKGATQWYSKFEDFLYASFESYPGNSEPCVQLRCNGYVRAREFRYFRPHEHLLIRSRS